VPHVNQWGLICQLDYINSQLILLECQEIWLWEFMNPIVSLRILLCHSKGSSDLNKMWAIWAHSWKNQAWKSLIGKSLRFVLTLFPAGKSHIKYCLYETDYDVRSFKRIVAAWDMLTLSNMRIWEWNWTLLSTFA